MIFQKFFQKTKEIIEQARALPYEKRLFILRVSLITTGLVLFILWLGIFKSEISSTHPLVVDKAQEEKVQAPSKWDIFKKGLYLTYEEHIVPIFKNIVGGLISFFALAVEVVIKMFNLSSYAFKEIFTQYKSYAQLIHYIFIR